MWKFSLREVVLVMTLFGIAMAVNVWNHRELRIQLTRTKQHVRVAEAHAVTLHCELAAAKQESNATNAQIRHWIASGELTPVPRIGCGIFRVAPNWDVLDILLPNQNTD